MLKKSGVILMSNHTITGLGHSLQLVYTFPLKQELLKLDLRLMFLLWMFTLPFSYILLPLTVFTVHSYSCQMYAAQTPLSIWALKLLKDITSVRLCGIYKFSLCIQWRGGNWLIEMKDGCARSNSLVRGGLEGYWKPVERIQKEVDLMKRWCWGTRMPVCA